MLQASPLEMLQRAIFEAILLPVAGLLAAIVTLLLVAGGAKYLLRTRRTRRRRSKAQLGVARGAGRDSGQPVESTPDSQAEAQIAYRATHSFLTSAERSFFGVLLQAVDGRFCVFAKVRLIDLIHVRPGVRERQAHFNRIVAKHIDFVLCDLEQVRPVLMIELDDASHGTSQRQERDAFVDQALEDAGIPILHLRTASSYTITDLRLRIDESGLDAKWPTPA